MSSRSRRLYLHANRTDNLVVRKLHAAISFGQKNPIWTKSQLQHKLEQASNFGNKNCHQTSQRSDSSAQPQAAECKTETAMFIADTVQAPYLAPAVPDIG